MFYKLASLSRADKAPPLVDMKTIMFNKGDTLTPTATATNAHTYVCSFEKRRRRNMKSVSRRCFLPRISVFCCRGRGRERERERERERVVFVYIEPLSHRCFPDSLKIQSFKSMHQGVQRQRLRFPFLKYAHTILYVHQREILFRFNF